MSEVLIRVLGPVDLLVGGDLVVIGSRQERMLLAALAISANHSTSADHLAQILWGDDPPPSRDNTLQTYISRLRSLLGIHRITSEDHSYQLTVFVDEMDALVFESVINQAASCSDDPDPCARLCRQALALWRGVPFGDLADLDPFRLEAIRLDELRQYAMELKLGCDIAAGREGLAIAALQAMVQESPYREGPWYLLISALTRTGRRVEALHACNELRGVLAEVGLELSREVAGLEEAILTDSPQAQPRLGTRYVPQPPPSKARGAV